MKIKDEHWPNAGGVSQKEGKYEFYLLLMSVESSRAGHLAPGGVLNMIGSGSRTPSYASDTLSRETIQFQDLHIFQQQPYPSPHHPLQDSLQRQTNFNSGASASRQSQHQNGSSAVGSIRATSPSMNSHLSEHQQIEFPFIEKIQLDEQCVTLIKEMRTVLQLSDDFERDVEKERESSRDLLCELQRKIRPFLVQLDEKAVVQEEVIKQQVDKCVVTDPRLNWLLKYNNFTQDFRKIIKTFMYKITLQQNNISQRSFDSPEQSPPINVTMTAIRTMIKFRFP
uniref:Uncharacterized protein n=1 Tax=Romanomermis culicivorax TaxID=13658 RepID=A0A915IL57_ROMCU